MIHTMVLLISETTKAYMLQVDRILFISLKRKTKNEIFLCIVL